MQSYESSNQQTQESGFGKATKTIVIEHSGRSLDVKSSVGLKKCHYAANKEDIARFAAWNQTPALHLS
jgi:hypothetical protein